ncbi:MAG: energy transducer TonB [Luteimonas sp.]
MLVTGSVEIEPDGRTSRVSIDKPEALGVGVVNMIEKQSRDWKFEPIVVDGRARPARAAMTLRMVAKKLDADRYSVEIRSASFGSDESQPGHSVEVLTLPPPRYPREAVESRVTGTVYLLVRIGRDGKVLDAIAEQTNLRIVSYDNDMIRFRRVLEKSSLSAARNWTFKPPTQGESAEQPSWFVRVPVDFTLSGGRVASYGEWDAYIPGPHSPAPWVSAKDLMAGGADAIANGGLYQLGSGLRLLTPLGPLGPPG